MTDMEKRFKTERGGGNYGDGTKELQARNYAKRKGSEADREGLFEKALDLFQKKDLEGVRCPQAAYGSSASAPLAHIVNFGNGGPIVTSSTAAACILNLLCAV